MRREQQAVGKCDKQHATGGIIEEEREEQSKRKERKDETGKEKQERCEMTRERGEREEIRSEKEDKITKIKETV